MFEKILLAWHYVKPYEFKIGDKVVPRTKAGLYLSRDREWVMNEDSDLVCFVGFGTIVDRHKRVLESTYPFDTARTFKHVYSVYKVRCNNGDGWAGEGAIKSACGGNDV